MTGTEKSSGSVSESQKSSESAGSTPSVSASSGSSSSSSGDVECTCLMEPEILNKTVGETTTTVTFKVSALGTCDLTIFEFTTSYPGDHVFSPTPIVIPGGGSENFAYSRPGDSAGDQVTIHYLCENGEGGEAFFTVP